MPEDNLSVSSMQGWKKQRLDLASAPLASTISNQECVVAVKGEIGLVGTGGEGAIGGSQQIMSGVRPVEVVAEVGLRVVFSDEEETAEGAVKDTSPQ